MKKLFRYLLVLAIITLCALGGEYIYFKYMVDSRDKSIDTILDFANQKPLVDVATVPVIESTPRCTHHAECIDFIKYATQYPNQEDFIGIYGRIVEFTEPDTLMLELKSSRVQIQIGSDLEYCNVRYNQRNGEFDLNSMPPDNCTQYLEPGNRLMGVCQDETCSLLPEGLLINIDHPDALSEVADIISDEETQEYYQKRKDEYADQQLQNLFADQIDLAGEWLINNQTENGDFIYRRSLPSGDPIDQAYSIVRQSGALYGLARLYNYSSDERYLDTLNKGITFFDAYSKTTTIDGKKIRYIDHEEITQSNTTALHVLAYLEMANHTPSLLSDEQEIYLQQMAQFLLATQLPSGGFNNHFISPLTSCQDSRECLESDYNNGESFLALVRMYDYSGDTKYLDPIKTAASYFIELYPDFNMEFYLWGSTAFSELYTLQQKPKYYNYVQTVSLQAVNEPDRYPALDLFLNDLSPYLPDFSQIVYTEGLLPAYHITEDSSENKASFSYAISSGLVFHALFQSPDPETIDSAVADVVLGGYCIDTQCVEQRLDIVHHSLGAYIDAMTYLDDEALALPVSSYVSTE